MIFYDMIGNGYLSMAT